MKSAPASIASQLALQVRVTAGILDRHDLVEHQPIVAGEEGAAVDDHVDLVGPRGHGLLGVDQLHVEARTA
jgi:hypothetical protein